MSIRIIKMFHPYFYAATPYIQNTSLPTGLYENKALKGSAYSMIQEYEKELEASQGFSTSHKDSHLDFLPPELYTYLEEELQKLDVMLI